MTRYKTLATALAVAFACTVVAPPPADAGFGSWIGGKVVKKGFESTGHHCASKPFWVPMPTWLWHAITCARTAS